MKVHSKTSGDNQRFKSVGNFHIKKKQDVLQWESSELMELH